MSIAQTRQPFLQRACWMSPSRLGPENIMSAQGRSFTGPGGFIQYPYLLGGSSSTRHCTIAGDEEEDAASFPVPSSAGFLASSFSILSFVMAAMGFSLGILMPQFASMVSFCCCVGG